MNRITKTWVTLGLFLTVVGLSCKKPNDRNVFDVLSNRVVIEWNNVAFEAAGGAEEGNPLLASRSNAMVHIAIHDALNAIVPLYKQYSYHQQNPFANPFAAAASAAHTVLRASWPDEASMLDAKLSASLSGIPDGAGKTQGIALGIASGKAILAMRAGDGAFQDPAADVPASSVPGIYNAVPPFNFMFAPFWKKMQLFSLQTHDQFRSLPPPALNSQIYTKSFNEVKEVGKLNSAIRTTDQSAYAKWWYEYSDIGWNRIARIQAADCNPGLYMTARMFALLNLAIADGYTAGWDSKYYYNFWRPYTAIRAAATDGNNETMPDPNWESAEPNPPVPDYPSTHSALGMAAATVLTHFFGSHSPFSMTSTTAFPAGAIRSFNSFTQAAEQNANSRVMAGIHFRFACEAGLKQGEKIGKWTLDNHLKPLY